MHFSVPVVLGVSILSSLGAAVAVTPEGPEWIGNELSNLHKRNGDQVEAVKNALTREPKINREMRKRMRDALGEEEAIKILRSRSAAAAECECRPSIWDYNCNSDENCITGGCAIPGGGCDPQMNEPCLGLCFPK